MACLPHDRKTESRVVTSADSLSKRIAKKIPIQSLKLVWSSAQKKAPEMQTPQTVKFNPSGDKIYVADAERNRVFVFSSNGESIGEVYHPNFKYPYLAGFQGDTLYVLNRGEKQLLGFLDGKVVSTQTTPDAPMTYVTIIGKEVFFKATGFDERFIGYVGKLEKDGTVSQKINFKAPYWRWLGFLKAWQGKPLSLSGYQPMVDLISGNQIDSLALQGFDSPMLSRRLLFLQKQVQEAPLLSSTAASFADELFVLNLRAGWIRLDVYPPSGVLKHILEEPQPKYIEERVPLDLDIFKQSEGSYLFAITEKNKTSNLNLYLWKP